MLWAHTLVTLKLPGMAAQDCLTILCRWPGALLGRRGLAAAMHASSCPQLCPAYSPVLTHFLAPKGLVSKELGLQLEAVCATRLKAEVEWVKGLQ